MKQFTAFIAIGIVIILGGLVTFSILRDKNVTVSEEQRTIESGKEVLKDDNKHTQEEIKNIDYSSMEELLNTPIVLPPITIAEQAINFGVHSFNKEQMMNVEKPSLFRGWRIVAESLQYNDKKSWKVQLTSKGFIPSYTCKISFTVDGHVDDSGHYCTYNPK
jgi:hypothetical protein